MTHVVAASHSGAAAAPPPRGLPIVIGVTGHRDLCVEDEAALIQAVENVFDGFLCAYPSTPLAVLTPLAEGADRLVARVALRRGIPYYVALPMAADAYRNDFTTGASLASFDSLVATAAGPPDVMPFFGTNDAVAIADGECRAQQYALVGAHLARSCHVLIALWDGEPSAHTGSTAHVVDFRLFGVPEQYSGAASSIDAPQTGPVYHIYTPRSTTAARTGVAGATCLRFRRAADAISVAALAAGDPFATMYGRIDTFNRDCAQLGELQQGAREHSLTERLTARAQRAASEYQKKISAALARLFLATGVAALAFELYAHLFPDVHPFALVYLCAAGVAIWTFLRARRGRWQDRAEDYRALEIGLRVQHVWHVAGLGLSVADVYLRLQRSELDWIRAAIRAAHTIDRHTAYDAAAAVAAVNHFVREQHAYFAGSGPSSGAARREKSRSERYERLSRAALRLSVGASIVLIAAGIAALVSPAFRDAVAEHETWHAGLIFTIALSAIAAALFNDYPARRAHRQHARRYELMAHVYGRAVVALDAAALPGSSPAAELDVARRCIRELGHEALTETGDWLLLHRELPIELLPLA